ncbi:MAG: tRNA-binding protein [Methanobrevibacter sp.]|jgi:predicted RNA-binding protein with EMAP domain|nr:tRNA-binding protein [Candidatus Methanovirga basalitermitum]
MWDTTKDYRILVAQKSKELHKRTVNSGSFRGHWNKKMVLEIAESMNSDFQTLKYSYLDPKDLINAQEINNLKKKIEEVIEYLGGNNWANKFLNRTPKKEKEKVEENIAKVKFFIRTILNLKERIGLGSILDPIVGVDILVGEIMSISKHRNNLMVTNVDINKHAIKVITNDLSVKEGNRVGIAILPPMNILGIVSEGMFLGDGSNILKDVGGKIGSMPKDITIESLNGTRTLVENFLKK